MAAERQGLPAESGVETEGEDAAAEGSKLSYWQILHRFVAESGRKAQRGSSNPLPLSSEAAIND